MNTRAERLQGCVDGFIRSSTLLKEDFEKSPSMLGVALIVNAAFAAELAIKRYIELTAGQPMKGHELKKLWSHIDEKVQDVVADAVCAQVPLERGRFAEYLDRCSASFVDWRYTYEKDSNFTNYRFLLFLATEIRKLR